MLGTRRHPLSLVFRGPNPKGKDLTPQLQLRAEATIARIGNFQSEGES